MFGPEILARSLTAPSPQPDRYGNHWQYHSRSDRHSKIACWAMLFDLLLESKLIRKHVESGVLRFGINHTMWDYAQNRKKNLDLVLCSAGSGDTRESRSLENLATKYGVDLTCEESTLLARLPELLEAPVGNVFLAVEAKACMTAHLKALPRLYDELNSSHLTIHGNSQMAIAAGFVMINAATRFLSSDMNKFPQEGTGHRNWSAHKQPSAMERAVDKVTQLPRRASTAEQGFDSLAIVLVNLANDGSACTVHHGKPAPEGADPHHYEQSIRRIAHLYHSRFPTI